MSIRINHARKRLPISAVALLLVLQVIALPSPSRATVATSSEMQQVCENWLTQKVYQQGSWAGDANPQIINSHDIYSGDTLVAKWYDIAPKGFVLVPVLKEMQPIKAYSDEYNLDYEQEGGFLSLVRDMLSRRASLYVLRTGSLDAPQSSAAEPVFGEGQLGEWDRLSVDAKSFRSSLPNSQATMSSGGPLLTSSWHQSAPYNNLCPMGDGDRAVVGCVATAAAQIMNYWHWPENGYRSHSYRWTGDASCGGSTPEQQLWADFSDSYDWANMPDSCDGGCSPEQEDAVAELCYEVGVSLNMGYGACGSGANTAMVATILPTYFKYSPNAWIEYRMAWDLPDWFYLIKGEIDAGRVCDYRINNHSIVADGYRNDYGKYEYHMNYGWGGSFTAWFVFDSLYCYWQPDSLCPADEEFVIVGIHPQTVPELSCKGVTIGDPDGNNNGVAAPGESVELTPIIRNMGYTAENVTAHITTIDPYVTITNSTATLSGSLAWGEESPTTAPFTFSTYSSCPDPHIVTFYLTVIADGTGSTMDTLYVFVGTVPGFEDQVENVNGLWKHYSPGSAYNDQWHMDTYRKHSGTYSWKAGGPGSVSYYDYCDSWLVSPPFLIPPNGLLTFWHWIAAEQDSEPGMAWDGANVYISSGDGNWTLLTPTGGYPYAIVDNPASPYDPGTPCYSGTQEWSQAEFDLSTYSGAVQLLFRFGSDGAVSEEGWYVDDISVTSTGCCGGYTGGYTGNTDCDSGGKIALSDITRLIDRVYLSKQPLCCEENGNTDGDNQGKIALGDITRLIDRVYLSKQPTSPCQ